MNKIYFVELKEDILNTEGLNKKISKTSKNDKIIFLSSKDQMFSLDALKFVFSLSGKLNGDFFSYKTKEELLFYCGKLSQIEKAEFISLTDLIGEDIISLLNEAQKSNKETNSVKKRGRKAKVKTEVEKNTASDKEKKEETKNTELKNETKVETKTSVKLDTSSKKTETEEDDDLDDYDFSRLSQVLDEGIPLNHRKGSPFLNYRGLAFFKDNIKLTATEVGFIGTDDEMMELIAGAIYEFKVNKVPLKENLEDLFKLHGDIVYNNVCNQVEKLKTYIQ